jgi:mannosyltransferase
VRDSQSRSGLVRLEPFSTLEIAALVGIVGIAGFLRFFDLGPGLDADESYSVDVATHSPGSILRILERTDTHPPLSYLLLHFWMQAFGSSEVAVRSLAALFGVGTVVALYFLGRVLWGPLAGLTAALFLALSQFNVQYSHNARMYTLMTFLTAASYYFFIRLRINPSRTVVVLYLISSTALIYTHVWGVFLVTAQTVVVAVVLLGTERTTRATMLVRWLFLQGCLLVLWSPWLFFGFRDQIETTLHDNGTAFGDLSQNRRPTAHDVIKAPYYAANTHTLAALFLVLVCLAIAVYFIRVVQSEKRSAATKESPSRALRQAAIGAVRDSRLVLVTAWFVIPLLMGLTLSYLITPIFVPRYLIALSLPVYLIAAAALVGLPSKLILIALCPVVAAAALNVERYTTTLSDFYRAPAQYVAARADPGDLVLYDMNSSIFDYYAHRSQVQGTFIRPHQDDRATIKLLAKREDAIDPRIRNPFAPATITTDLKALSAATRMPRVWLLLGPQFPGQLSEGMATRKLRAAFGPPHLRSRVGKFDVFLFERH